MKTQTKTDQAKLTPLSSLALLRKGNERFKLNLKANRDLLEQVNSTAEGQHPFAVILSCIDSRTSVELLFDQGLGDVFSIRVAGNILNEDILGSMEYACAVAGSKLIVVLGHSSCGAVRGVCDDVKLGHLTGLLDKLKPALLMARKEGEASEEELVQRVAEKNVLHVVQEIRQRSDVLSAMIETGHVGIVGAMYSVSSGHVEFQDLLFRSD